jgi:hypothetical protein
MGIQTVSLTTQLIKDDAAEPFYLGRMLGIVIINFPDMVQQA